MTGYRNVAFFCFFFLLFVDHASSELPSGFQVETVVPDAEIPVALTAVDDGRIFYAELLTGAVRVIQDGVLLSEPFLTLDVATSFDVGGARGLGLLGLAADPNFSENGFLYVMYTPTPNEIVVSRFEDVAGVGIDEVEILRQPGDGKHNGGRLVFLQDNTFLITRGDTGFKDFSQDPALVQGKILRINVDGSIPDDNPIADSPVYALGVRNSFGIAVHPITGEGFFSENGRNEDEINMLHAGGNYGWPICAGNCISPDPQFTDPILNITPSICPTGMDFYSANTFPEQYRNDLFFTDCNTGQVQRIKLLPPLYDKVVMLENFVPGQTMGTLDVKTGTDGMLYFTTFDGVFRVAPPLGNEAAAEVSGFVSGVRGDGSQKTIVGAKVVLKERSNGATVFKHKTITDEQGRYHFTGLPAGSYKLVVKKKGYNKEKNIISLEVGNPEDFDIVLTEKLS